MTMKEAEVIDLSDSDDEESGEKETNEKRLEGGAWKVKKEEAVTAAENEQKETTMGRVISEVKSEFQSDSPLIRSLNKQIDQGREYAQLQRQLLEEKEKRLEESERKAAEEREMMNLEKALMMEEWKAKEQQQQEELMKLKSEVAKLTLDNNNLHEKIEEQGAQLQAVQEKEVMVNREAAATVDRSAEMEASAAAIPSQPSRAAFATQTLGIDQQLLEEDQPRNEFKEKFEELSTRYDALTEEHIHRQMECWKVEQLYKAEQKVTANLRKKLKEMERLVISEELTPVQLDDEQPREELNGAVSSPPVDDGTNEKRTRKLRARRFPERQQLDFDLSSDEKKEEESGDDDGGRNLEEEEEGDATGRFHPTTTTRPTANSVVRGRRRQLGGSGRRALPMKKKKTADAADTAAANVVAVGGGIFKCAQCPSEKAAFSSAEQLAKHRQRFHADRRHYRHQCPECGRRYPTNFDLTRHQRTHTGEKPFQCRRCGRGFAQRHDLADHERTHTGERPHVCAVCQRAFAHRSNLNAHARLHSDETPFSCRHCARQFRQSTHCRGHEKICRKRK